MENAALLRLLLVVPARFSALFNSVRLFRQDNQHIYCAGFLVHATN